MNDLTPVKAGEIIEAVIARGDIAQLSPQERAKYYVRVCESVGLNPMTRPFEYITLNGKLTLYARKDCTDQLRTIHGVSVNDLIETERDGVFVVTAKVENAKGRRDASKGAVSIQGLKGEALANALMKAETKAKRRATLSICGLGFLDETEAETIPGATRGTDPASYPETPTPPDPTQWTQEKIEAAVKEANTLKVEPEVTAGTAHDKDGVVWEEEGERAATANDVPEPPTPGAAIDTTEDDNGTPAFLKRTAKAEPKGLNPKLMMGNVEPEAKAEAPKVEPKPAAKATPKAEPKKVEPEPFDVAQWLKDLEGAATGCETLDELIAVQNKIQIPAKKHVTSKTDWEKGKAIVLAASGRILGDSSDEAE